MYIETDDDLIYLYDIKHQFYCMYIYDSKYDCYSSMTYEKMNSICKIIDLVK
jgi:hypothetical protein